MHLHSNTRCQKILQVYIYVFKYVIILIHVQPICHVSYMYIEAVRSYMPYMRYHTHNKRHKTYLGYIPGVRKII
jgi:hypothetical protein